MTFEAAEDRYDADHYRYIGRSGLKLPRLSLGLWQNFGVDRPEETQRAILRRAFDRGVTHFDLANNYGPPYGRAEENFGRYLAEDFAPYRDELVISTKAGYDMWPGSVRPGRRLAQVRAGLARPVPAADGAGVRRHLLQPPLRPRDARRGDDDGARHRRAVRAGAVRRHLVVLRREDRRGGHHRPRARHAAADPPAVVLDAQPLDRGRPARHPRGARDGLHRVHGAGAGAADRPVPERRARGLPRGAGGLHDRRAGRRRARPRAVAERDRPSAVGRSSPSSPCSGRSATRASRPP